MQKGRNPNHPKKGQSITMEPIRKLEDIRAITTLLSDEPRNQLFFTMGVNNGLRAGDLLRLKVHQVSHLAEGDSLTIRESKTGKKNVLVVNGPIYKALQGYLEKVQPAGDDFLYKSRKGSGPLTIQAINYLIKKWTATINLKGRYGAHTLRKTWGYIQRTEYGVGYELIAKRYNHSNPAVTMRYLGIEDKEVMGILLNEIG